MVKGQCPSTYSSCQVLEVLELVYALPLPLFQSLNNVIIVFFAENSYTRQLYSFLPRWSQNKYQDYSVASWDIVQTIFAGGRELEL
jgi:hypothetical protein